MNVRLWEEVKEEVGLPLPVLPEPLVVIVNEGLEVPIWLGDADNS